MGYPLRLNYEVRKDVANDLIAYLSAFGISRGDAEACIGHAKMIIRDMSAEQYIKTGASMKAFKNAMEDSNSERPTN